jgi:hypothetical protein
MRINLVTKLRGLTPSSLFQFDINVSFLKVFRAVKKYRLKERERQEQTIRQMNRIKSHTTCILQAIMLQYIIFAICCCFCGGDIGMQLFYSSLFSLVSW